MTTGDDELALGAYFVFVLSAGWVRTQTLSALIEDVKIFPENVFDSPLYDSSRIPFECAGAAFGTRRCFRQNTEGPDSSFGGGIQN